MARIIRLDTGKVEHSFDGQVAMMHSTAVSSGGSRAVLSGQYKIRLRKSGVFIQMK